MNSKRKKIRGLISMGPAVAVMFSCIPSTTFCINQSSKQARLLKLAALPGITSLVFLAIYIIYAKSGLVRKNSREKDSNKHEDENSPRDNGNNKNKEQSTQKTVLDYYLKTALIASGILLILLAALCLAARYCTEYYLFEFINYKIPKNPNGYDQRDLDGTTAYFKILENKGEDHSNDIIVLSFQGNDGSGINGIDLCKNNKEKFIKSVAAVTYTGSFGTGKGCRFRKFLKISEKTVYTDA